VDISFLRDVQGLPTPSTSSVSRTPRRGRGRRSRRSIGVQASLGGRSTARRRLAWPY
jgi:hypothetical protein